MIFNKKNTAALIAAMSLSAGAHAISADSGVYITEWMYSGNGGEFVELTNLSGGDIDFTGWSYDDDSQVAGTFDLSGFGIVADGESVIFTEDDAAIFRSDWSLNSSVKVLGGVSNNIGRGDEINIYGAFDGTTFPLIDTLTYGDNDFPGTIRTKDISGNPSTESALGANDVSLWVLSSLGDMFGSYESSNGDIGNPGSYSAVPVPAAVWLFGSALLGLISQRKRVSV